MKGGVGDGVGDGVGEDEVEIGEGFGEEVDVGEEVDEEVDVGGWESREEARTVASSIANEEPGFLSILISGNI